MSWLSEAFHGGKNPADAAMPYLEQIPGKTEGYLGSYSDTGKQSNQLLQDALQGLLTDPQGFLNDIMGGYQPSSGYEAKKKELLGQASNTAAAGGFTGTDSDVRNQLGITDELMSKDMQDYLNNVLGIFKTGMTGESDLQSMVFY